MKAMLDAITTQLNSYGVAADVWPNDNKILFKDNGTCNPSEMGL